jgi:hypothetical protein
MSISMHATLFAEAAFPRPSPEDIFARLDEFFPGIDLDSALIPVSPSSRRGSSTSQRSIRAVVAERRARKLHDELGALPAASKQGAMFSRRAKDAKSITLAFEEGGQARIEPRPCLLTVTLQARIPTSRVFSHRDREPRHQLARTRSATTFSLQNSNGIMDPAFVSLRCNVPFSYLNPPAGYIYLSTVTIYLASGLMRCRACGHWQLTVTSTDFEITYRQ